MREQIGSPHRHHPGMTMTMELALENAVYWEEHGDANLAAGWFAVAVDKEAELKWLGRVMAYGFDPDSL